MDDLEGLTALLPPGAVSTHHGELGARASDRWALALLREVRGDRVAPPAAVVWPTGTKEVSAVLSWAADRGVAVVTRGGGTGRAGGAQAAPRSILLETTRMNRVLGVDEVSQVVRAEAGVRLSDLEDAALARGLSLGPPPDEAGHATLGGWLAGGVPRAADRIVGLEVVLPGGDVLRTLEAPARAPGPDLARLLAGSEGTFGVITEAAMSLRRAPAEVVWEVLRPHSFDAGVSLARELAQRPFRWLVLRLFDPGGAGARFAAFGEGHRPLLMVAMDRAAPAVEAERFELRLLAKEFGARGLERDLADHWWSHRDDDELRYDGVMGAERTLGTGVVADSVMVSSLWRTLPRVYEEVRGALLGRAESVGSFLDGATSSGASLTFDFVVRASDDRAAEREYLSAWDAAAAAARAGGGTLSGEGVGVVGVGVFAEQLGPEAVAALQRLKGAFDPRGVMNPGKMMTPPGYDPGMTPGREGGPS
jgi:FAD/FMN-containing dehydrogenase